MEWDPNERDAWVSDAQRWISSIKGVLQCKIDLDSEGEISGIHVVAGMEREPRHIVRDVESLLKARLEIDVFYKKIGVVQVLDNDSSENELENSPAAEPVHQTNLNSHLDTTQSKVSTGPNSDSNVTFHPMDDEPHLDDSLLGDSFMNRANSTILKSEPELGRSNFESSSSENFKSDNNKPDSLKTEPSLTERSNNSNSSKADDADDLTADGPAPIPAVLLTEEGPLRIVCSGVGVMASDLLVRAEVQLRTGDIEVRGTQEGANHAGSAVQLVARATLDALMQLVSDPILLHLNEVRIDRLGDESVVLCAIDLVEGRKNEMLFGSCSNLHNEQQAVVFAVMDALNRRLSMYSLKSAQAES